MQYGKVYNSFQEMFNAKQLKCDNGACSGDKSGKGCAGGKEGGCDDKDMRIPRKMMDKLRRAGKK